MRRARRSREGPGVAMRDVLLVERVDGDGVGGGGGRGTTGAGGAFGDLRRYCSLISWPLHTARPVRTAPEARCDVLGMPAVETIVAISSHARLTKANLDGFFPSPYNATSLSFTALTRTSVSWRAPGKFAIIIAIRHGTSAPAFKGNVRWRSDWFIARYAQTTPMSNVATSDQPILDLRRVQESFIPPA